MLSNIVIMIINAYNDCDNKATIIHIMNAAKITPNNYGFALWLRPPPTHIIKMNINY